MNINNKKKLQTDIEKFVEASINKNASDISRRSQETLNNQEILSIPRDFNVDFDILVKCLICQW